jgi:phosphate transport system substrate-binding protein
VAWECLRVLVQKDNPLQGLTLPQLDCIFSSTRNTGYREIATWGELGLSDPAWANMPLSLYGSDLPSETRAFFGEVALFKGDCKDTAKKQPDRAGVVNGVANDRAGIGYSRVGRIPAGVRVLPLAQDHTVKLSGPTSGNNLDRSYPLARSIYLYVDTKPSALVAEFVKFVLSKQGQEIVLQDDFVPFQFEVIPE